MKNRFSKKVKIKFIYAESGKKFCTCKLTKEEFNMITKAAHITGKLLDEFFQDVIDETIKKYRYELTTSNFYRQNPIEKRIYDRPTIICSSAETVPLNRTERDVLMVALSNPINKKEDK